MVVATAETPPFRCIRISTSARTDISEEKRSFSFVAARRMNKFTLKSKKNRVRDQKGE